MNRSQSSVHLRNKAQRQWKQGILERFHVRGKGRMHAPWGDWKRGAHDPLIVKPVKPVISVSEKRRKYKQDFVGTSEGRGCAVDWCGGVGWGKLRAFGVEVKIQSHCTSDSTRCTHVAHKDALDMLSCWSDPRGHATGPNLRRKMLGSRLGGGAAARPGQVRSVVCWAERRSQIALDYCVKGQYRRQENCFSTAF